MTREEILQAFDDINFVYNDCTRYDTLKRMLEELTERKRGEWQVYYDEDSPQDGIWKCSICSYTRLIDDISPTNYCPNCGAEMRQKEVYQDD